MPKNRKKLLNVIPINSFEKIAEETEAFTYEEILELIKETKKIVAISEMTACDKKQTEFVLTDCEKYLEKQKENAPELQKNLGILSKICKVVKEMVEVESRFKSTIIEHEGEKRRHKKRKSAVMSEVFKVSKASKISPEQSEIAGLIEYKSVLQEVLARLQKINKLLKRRENFEKQLKEDLIKLLTNFVLPADFEIKHVNEMIDKILELCLYSLGVKKPAPVKPLPASWVMRSRSSGVESSSFTDQETASVGAINFDSDEYISSSSSDDDDMVAVSFEEEDIDEIVIVSFEEKATNDIVAVLSEKWEKGAISSVYKGP